MKRFFKHILLLPAIVVLLTAISSGNAYALPVGHYAANSVLSSGKWVRITVPSTGVHYISNATLRNMGFGDASKVNVYGTGGGMVPEGLSESMADDLPLLPVARNSGGIIFFGRDIFTWSVSSRGAVSHSINPYGTESYYFLSDREPVSEVATAENGSVAGLPAITEFDERIVHENDLAAPSETGRLMLGEDFRSQRQRQFSFQLPGCKGDASVKVSFGAKVTNGSSSVILTANGVRMLVTDANRIPGANGEQFIVTREINANVESPGDKLDLRIDYSNTGALFTARLDYIEVFYKRDISVAGGSVYFNVTPSVDAAVHVAGATAETEVWDVTLPGRPRRVNVTLEGSTAVFRVKAGYGEYVAVNPSQVAVSNSSYSYRPVANQDLHGMETPDMVIITLPEYMEGARRLAALHEKADSMMVAVLTPDVIYNEFSGGTPDVSAFRKLLKMWYDRPGERKIGYCLLMGRASFDNKNVTAEQKSMGYEPLPIWQSPTGTTEVSSYSTDAYIAMLDDCEPGTLNLNSAKQRVSVGRLPVTSAQEAARVAAKIEKYVLEPTLGPWRNKIMIIADDGDNSLHLTQSQDVISRLSAGGNGASFLYDRVYLDSYELQHTSLGACYPAAKERMMRNFNEGVVFTNYVGHASPQTWTHEKLLMWSDILSFANPNPTFLYAATCSFGKWDAMNVSGAEILVLSPNAGAIGIITPSRTVYMGQNGTLNRYMADNLFKRDSSGLARRWGDAFRESMNLYVDDNKLRYCVIGDPALRIQNPVRSVRVSAINGESLDDAGNMPVLPALSKARIEGYVALPGGDVDAEFNGTLNLQLFDAERVITTHGNNDATVLDYNDHTTRLSSVSVKVRDGRWSTTLVIPSEIENNYSPALLSCYAWSDTGDEANGHCGQFYVYGASDSEVNDVSGPVIESFYLGTPSFTDGAMVGNSVTASAVLSDESGINLSESGIGHGLMLTLDGKTFYNDVNSFYTPDSEREGAGSFSYPLNEIEPGEHTLELTAWDNVGNSSKSSLTFNVGANSSPVISSLGTDVNPASTSVVFSVGLGGTDRVESLVLEVFDLSGRKIWSETLGNMTGTSGSYSSAWNLCDDSGSRVPRGIYNYRAVVTTTDGTYSSKTKKLAVTAQ